MQYLKTKEVADMYNVSRRTVVRWIEQAREGKNDLEIIQFGKRFYVVDSSVNRGILKKLSTENKKYISKKFKKSVNPTQKFYDTFSDKQIFDLINSINLHKEIPHKFCYFNGSAEFWDRFLSEGLDTLLPLTIQTLRNIKQNLFEILSSYKKINIIDIGPGNGMPVKEFVGELYENRKLNKYIAIDYSKDMLKILEKNLVDWFGSEFPAEYYVRDINYDVFQDIVYKHRYDSEGNNNECVNLIFFLGGTIQNQLHYDQTFWNINNSMGKDDYLIVSQLSLNNHYHPFGALGFSSFNKKVKNSDLEQELLLVKMLGLEEDDFDVERIFDEKDQTKKYYIVLKNDVVINIVQKTFKEEIFLPKHEKIIIFRDKRVSVNHVLNKLDECGLEFIFGYSFQNKGMLTVLCRLKTR